MLTDDEKSLICLSLGDSINTWEKCANDVPDLASQFKRQIEQAEAIIEKLTDE